MLSSETMPASVSFPPAQTPLVLPPPVAPPIAVATVPVLHVINGEHYAGAERVQDLLAQRLPEVGFSVGFACLKLDRFDALRHYRDAPLYDVPMLGRFDLAAAARVATIVRQGGYHLIHAHTVRTALISSLASRLSGAPMVYHVHSPASRNSTRWWRERLNAIVERLSMLPAARLIAVSQAMGRHMVGEGCDPARIVVVPNGVPTAVEPFNRIPPAGNWTLGVVALFRPRKGIEVFLDAIDQLRRAGRFVRIRAVGAFETPRYEAEIIARTERLGLSEQITWTGFAQNVGDELRKMDILVLPSLFGEGLPMVVLEAMAAGVPVVAARVEGVPEAIDHGREGLLVEPGDAADLARAIAAVIDGDYDWSSLSRRAVARHAAQFSDRAMAAGVAAVYRDVLGIAEPPHGVGDRLAVSAATG
jgi:glycosyltransferase involved in cell wall biosynthesis